MDIDKPSKPKIDIAFLNTLNDLHSENEGSDVTDASEEEEGNAANYNVTYSSVEDIGSILDNMIDVGDKHKALDEEIYIPSPALYKPRQLESWCENKNLYTAAGEAHLQGKRNSMEDSSSMYNCLLTGCKLYSSTNDISRMTIGENEAGICDVYVCVSSLLFA